MMCDGMLRTMCDGMLYVLRDGMFRVICELMLTYLECGRLVEESLMAENPGRLHCALLHCFNVFHSIVMYYTTLNFTGLYCITLQ